MHSSSSRLKIALGVKSKDMGKGYFLKGQDFEQHTWL